MYDNNSVTIYDNNSVINVKNYSNGFVRVKKEIRDAQFVIFYKKLDNFYFLGMLEQKLIIT